MKKKFVFIVLLITLILSACGQGKPSSKINVEMTDFAFTPNQYTVPAGAQITLNVTHAGLVDHDFVIMKLNTDIGGHFNEEDLVHVYWQIKIQPGDSQTVTSQPRANPAPIKSCAAWLGMLKPVWLDNWKLRNNSVTKNS